MSKRRQAYRALLVGAAAAVASATMGVPPSAATAMLAPVVSDEPAAAELSPPPAWAERLVADANEKSRKDPGALAGAWYESATGTVVVHARDAARGAESLTALHRAAARAEVTPRRARVAVVQYTLDDLDRIATELVEQRRVADVEINAASVQPRHNRVVAGLGEITEQARAELAARYGTAVAVKHTPRQALPQSGPDRWKDRYPYWGGAGYHQNGTQYWDPDPAVQGPGCTTAFSMRRGGSDPRHFALTAGHCSTSFRNAIEDMATLDGESTRWNNYIGSNGTYRNTYDTGGGYGDVTVFRTNGGEPVIYSGTDRRSAQGSTIRSKQGGVPAAGTPLCVSGARSGLMCHFVATGETEYWTNPAGRSIGPLIEAETTGRCTIGGDSGAPWVRQVSGGFEARGVHFGLSPDNTSAKCRVVFTSVSLAEEAMDASVMVNP